MSEFQRIRIRYTKLGRTRYLSARDLTSVWERSLRRAELPIAYSQGYTPHAKVSFPDAMPVGLASTGEYAELSFAAPIDPGPALGSLSAALPEGMKITTYLEVPDGAPKLAKMLRCTLWELAWLPDGAGAGSEHDVDDLTARGATAIDAFLDQDSVSVTKHRPSGDKTIDARTPVITAACVTGPAPAWTTAAMPDQTTAAAHTGTATLLRVLLRNGGATVRPPDLVTALAQVTPGDPLPSTRHACRVAQGAVVDEGCKEALTGQVERLVPVAAEAA